MPKVPFQQLYPKAHPLGEHAVQGRWNARYSRALGLVAREGHFCVTISEREEAQIVL